MTQRRTLFIALIVLFASCKKQEKTSNSAYTPPEQQKPAYAVEGITSIILKHGLDSSAMKLSIVNLTNEMQTASISVGNTPQDITASIDKSEAVLPYRPQITMRAFFTRPGAYNYNIFVQSGEKIVTKAAQLIINAMDSKLCAEIFYNALVLESGPYYAYKNLYGLHLYRDKQTGKIYIGNGFALEVLNYEYAYLYSGTKPEIFIEPDCNNRTITIPEVTVIGFSSGLPNETRDYKISGDGTINHIDSSFLINFRINNADGTNLEAWKLMGKLKF